MLPKEWTPPCGSRCTKKYANLVQIPWRVFCKKGCDTDGETWEEWHYSFKREGGYLLERMIGIDVGMGRYCGASRSLEIREHVYPTGFKTLILSLGECNEICYKDPVFKDHQWSAYIDRSPGDDNYSLECFHACVSGCGFKFDIPIDKVEQVRPNRPPKQTTVSKRKPAVPDVKPTPTTDDLPCTSA